MILELDAAGSNVDGTNPGTALVIVNSATGWYLAEFDAPAPEAKVLWASSIDTDGARRADPGAYENRTVTASLDILKSTAALTQAAVRSLSEKIGKLHREGGTLKVTYPSGNTLIFDLLAGTHNLAYNHTFVIGNLAQISLSFTALPGARGAEVDLGDNVETTLPALVFTEVSVPGDLTALAKLVVDNDVAADQWWIAYGVQSRYYSSSANAALFYEAEGRTALGGSATAVGATGASGGGSNVMRNTSLTNAYQGILSTQATGGGAHLSHIGTFRMFARIRVLAGQGTLSVALEWAEGDFTRVTRNTPVTLAPPTADEWRLIDLGIVSPKSASQGTQRWEGRIVAKTTNVGDDLDVDYLLLMPVDEGYATVTANWPSSTPSTLTARDEFAHAVGALHGKTLPSGGTWSSTGATGDWNVNASLKAEHTSTTTGSRIGVAGTSSFTNCMVQADVAYTGSSAGPFSGVLGRWVDASNYLVAYLQWVETSTTTAGLVVSKTIGGAATQIASISGLSVAATGAEYTIRLFVDTSGRYAVWVFLAGTAPGSPVVVGYDSVLATSGTLASGRAGMTVGTTAAIASSRTHDNFWAAAVSPDAAVYASQSIQLAHDGVTREDSSGVAWPGRVPVGSHLRMPPSGQESRTARLVIKACRNDPATMPDPVLDDLSARLFVIPRYLNVPSA
jgi:hypothetical protein